MQGQYPLLRKSGSRSFLCSFPTTNLPSIRAQDFFRRVRVAGKDNLVKVLRHASSIRDHNLSRPSDGHHIKEKRPSFFSRAFMTLSSNVQLHPQSHRIATA